MQRYALLFGGFPQISFEFENPRCPSAAGPAWGLLSVGRVGRHPRATGCCVAQNLYEIGLKRLRGMRF